MLPLVLLLMYPESWWE